MINLGFSIKNIYIFRLQYYFFFFLRGIITKGSQFFFSFSAVFFQMGLKGIYIYIYFSLLLDIFANDIFEILYIYAP